jgi:Na+-translocating ferredoxin:NAD+ oxidoreductase RNF subunit RnfB
MSKITKFTKGIWDWEHDESTASMIQIDSDIGCSICRLQSENDAYLISAAPEMYKMLDDLANGRGTDYPIEQLLSKARGESI